MVNYKRQLFRRQMDNYWVVKEAPQIREKDSFFIFIFYHKQMFLELFIFLQVEQKRAH